MNTSTTTTALRDVPAIRRNTIVKPADFADSIVSKFQTSYTMTLPPAGRPSLITESTRAEIAHRRIPDLRSICEDLHRTFAHWTDHSSALQFLPVFQQLVSLSPGDVRRFLKNPDTRHILVQNSLLKVVLIHWRPGDESDIHGHAVGGCLFKVLHGSLVEKRYSTDGKQRLLSKSTCNKGSIAYIDDIMAFHTVGNPSNNSAISLHVYTPGIK